MVDLMLASGEATIRGQRAVRTKCDPCCGSGGMLTSSKA
jgi:type I restriction-modification system DNA methylase subunit